MQEDVDVDSHQVPTHPFQPRTSSTHDAPSLDFAHQPTFEFAQHDRSVAVRDVAVDDITRFRDAASCRLQQLQVWFSAELEEAFGAMYHLHEACLQEIVLKWEEENGVVAGLATPLSSEPLASLHPEPALPSSVEAAEVEAPVPPSPSSGGHRGKARESLVVPCRPLESAGPGRASISSRCSGRPSIGKGPNPSDMWTGRGRLSGRGDMGTGSSSVASGFTPRFSRVSNCPLELSRGFAESDARDLEEPPEEPVASRRKTVAFRQSLMKAEDDLAQKSRSSLAQRSKDEAVTPATNGFYHPGAIASNAPPGAGFPPQAGWHGWGTALNGWSSAAPGWAAMPPGMPLNPGGPVWAPMPPAQMPMGPAPPQVPAPAHSARAAAQTLGRGRPTSHLGAVGGPSHLGAVGGARHDAPQFGMMHAQHQIMPGNDANGGTARGSSNSIPHGRKSMDEQRLEICPVWTDRKRKTASVGTLRVMAFEAFDDEEDVGKVFHGDNDFSLLNTVQRVILQPNCCKRLAWDFLGCCFIMYDVVWIPLQLFNPETSPFTWFMQWSMRLFWTLDIPLSVLTGFMYADGNVEMNVLMILARYARTWLLLDLVVVAFDWIDAFMVGVGGVSAARMAKTMRIVRMLRVFRLLRMAKLPIIAGTWLETYVRSEKVMLVGHMIKIMCLIIATMHFIACIWWGIGNMDNLRANWVTPDLDNDAFMYQYTTSFHWSLTQFTGSMEVDPVNVVERSFAIFVLLFAFVISAMFISSITSSMTRLQMISGSKTAMFASLRQYLCDNQISRRLVSRISRNAHHAFEEYQRTTPESEIELLQLVSEPLRVELHFELYAPTLELNPFFARYQEANPAAVRRVCHAAVSVTFLSMGDVLFVDGEAPQIPLMWFIIRGSLSYKRQDEHSPKRISVSTPIGNWICEPVLWCSWIHCGVLRAESDCRLLVLDAATFQLIAPQFSTSDFQVGLYATEFVRRLNKLMESGHLSDIDETKESVGSVETVFNMKASDETKSMKQNFWANGLSRATKFFGTDRTSRRSEKMSRMSQQSTFSRSSHARRSEMSVATNMVPTDFSSNDVD